MVIIALIIINLFISQTILNIYLDQEKLDSLTSANTISNRIKYYLTPISSEMIEIDGYLKGIVESYSKEIESRIIIVNNNNIVKGDSNGRFIGEVFKHDEIQKALKGDVNSSIYKLKQFGNVMYVAVPIKMGDDIIGATLVSTSLNDIYTMVDEINKKLVVISLTSILIIAFLSFVFAGFLAKPIDKFISTIKKISHGNLEEKVTIETNDEFKKMADIFNTMVTKLNQVDTQRKDFVANVSHELRTPLSSIKLLSESLVHQEEGNIEIYKEFLKDINDEVDRLNNIISDLLTLVDMDKKKLHLDYKTTYINYLLERIVHQIKPLAEEKSIDLNLKTNEQIQINIDSDKIKQAIINIIHNGIKYTKEGGYVNVSLYSKDNFAIIEIEDNGIGIDKDSLAHIFDRFYRVDKARSRNTGGTGLGLSITHQIVSLHQGTIEVESEPEKGTTFYIKLPTDVGVV
ncbi:ATP-binding protein [Dethiothermospora halolimnae]|uniref:sensor histidine kinase n=1 Tax=Dethiothermospora halolimnae TaxID=3114390 RepID=UPI003CCBE55E